ncbi:MAG: flagellar biosynthesis repressor FlbT [Deltaproteobacteria bacterium]|nr:flagellar biosynthesis repressor FlbT [Deltaproteobacteria bacterium]MBW1737333.1 flagellar biosynthesis repressor FlbT [Deltaproteobacteria bacterium]MBW1909018.1 flagellar biosynthesis repressor FlbT [Deltaproteobacteria bacterium]MBW2034540.1 flagellar biosynthesis repressor FlbT [Deltaproteobacteria bacterium]MBW2114669.1 flagellar biosynthesis repressor FlbT [Deltaproteobacteria bacterium]
MPLKITLKPNERMIIGGAVVTNGNTKSDFIIENNVPILRQKDIMSVKDAGSPGSRIYFVIQLMYIDEENLTTHHNTYWKLVQDFVKAAPSMLGLIDQISEHILSNRHYQALKLSKKLIVYEQEEMSYAYESIAGIQYHQQGDHVRP